MAINLQSFSSEINSFIESKNWEILVSIIKEQFPEVDIVLNTPLRDIDLNNQSAVEIFAKSRNDAISKQEVISFLDGLPALLDNLRNIELKKRL